MTMTANDDQFRDLLDRWEDLHEQGQEPSVEELCRDAPHLAERLRDWTQALRVSDWMCRRADEVADETLGESGTLTAEERKRHGTLGEYDLLDELGGGGMGRVFKAVHRKMNRTVALKLLPESLVQSPESVERFQREVQALARLSHPNIVAVHDAGTAEGTHFYVMDLVVGEDLARLVKEHGPMPVEQALDCILQAARGLEYAHAQGVVHRDIKPSNLILDHDGTVRILDLGIARFSTMPEQTGDDLTKTGCVLGTVDYMAPEQAMNTRLADHRADIYSLGCTLYCLLTGQPLYGGDTVMERLVAHREHPVPSLRKACPAAPAWLDGILRKMVAKKPEDRYQSATALVSDLERHAAPRSWRRLVVAIVTVLLLAVGSWLATRPHRELSSQNQEQEKLAKLPAKKEVKEKAVADKARAEADKARAEADRARAEADKAEAVARAKKAEAETTRAEAKAEEEAKARAQVEAKKAQAVAEAKKADADKARAEADKAEAVAKAEEAKRKAAEEKANPIVLPVKPTWRTTGEYPLIAGVWSIVQNKGTLVTIVQHGGDFVATASYKSGEEAVSWRAEGRISHSGHITMSFVHTQPHPPDKWLPQTRTAVLSLNGKALEGYAAYEGGGHKFTWRLVEAREAEAKELSK